MHVTEFMEIIITLSIGSLIVIGLLLCYSLVFRQMCCPPRPKPNARGDTKAESISLKYLTHISSQPTDTSVV